MKKKDLTAFERYKSELTEAEAERISLYFRDFEAHNALTRTEKNLMRADFESALLYYRRAGLSLDDALSRLDISHLGGFYIRPSILWYALDDAAKIYPLSMKHGQMAVFRLSVYFKQPIEPEILQIALTFTIKRFPSFATTVKKGFFWHYLDACKRRYFIEKESGIPCRPLNIARTGSQSFRVLYYHNRISVEYFHILTDGTGGMAFLKALTREYLRLLGVSSPSGQGILDVDEIPSPGETANEFTRAEKTESASGFMDKLAVQMSGRLFRTRPCRILHLKMDMRALADAAKSRNATITAYTLALLFLAGRYATDEASGEISLQVPVNMRKFYPSDTLRNFSMYCGIRLPIAEITTIDAILPRIARLLQEKASKKSMSEMMNATERLVRVLRFIPLFIKAPAARIVYGFLGDRIFSNTFSNIGVVTMPKELAEHIESMDFVLGTPIANRAACTMVTCNGITTLSITKLTDDPTFEERLVSLLKEDGIETRVEGSDLYEY